jgi:hypothetical protein
VPHARCERTKSVVSALVQGCCDQGARLSTRRKAAEHRELTVSRPHPQASARTGARRGAALRARACAVPPQQRGLPSRRTPPRCRCVRAQRARTAPSGAQAHGRASARLARGRGGARTTEHWARVRTRRCHARVPRAAGSEGPAEAQARQWSKPRTAREGEKLCVRTSERQAHDRAVGGVRCVGFGDSDSEFPTVGSLSGQRSLSHGR